MSRTKTTQTQAGSFLGDLLREIAKRDGEGDPKNAALLDAADHEALLVMGTEGLFGSLCPVVPDLDFFNSAVERLATMQDPKFETRGDAFDKLEERANISKELINQAGIGDGDTCLSDAVLSHRVIASNAAFALGLSIGRRIGGGR